MTTPLERTRALQQAKELLEAILSSEEWPDLPTELRQQARTVLRHYPGQSDLRVLGKIAPAYFARISRDQYE